MRAAHPERSGNFVCNETGSGTDGDERAGTVRGSSGARAELECTFHRLEHQPTGTAPVSTYEWGFGGDTRSHEKALVQTFSAEGRHAVALTSASFPLPAEEARSIGRCKRFEEDRRTLRSRVVKCHLSFGGR